MASNNSGKDTASNPSSSTLPQHVQQRNRSIAEREASRLARPDRPQVKSIGHASKHKSAVTSTPLGYHTFKSSSLSQDDSNDTSDAWCGPFSVARQMIAQREEMKRKRLEEQQNQQEEDGTANNENSNNPVHPLDELVQRAENEKKRKLNPSLTWKPKLSEIESNNNNKHEKVPNQYYKRQKRIQKQISSQNNNNSNGYNKRIPTLFQICVNYIVEQFENVESLGLLVDHTIRRSLCQNLISQGKMNGAAFDTLAESGIETLDIIDCTSVTSVQMSETLEKLIPAGLRALILDHAGRCFTTQAVQSIVKHHYDLDTSDDNEEEEQLQRHRRNIIQLCVLSIGGAYLLQDADIAKLIFVSSSTLSSIALKACPLVGLHFCNAISTHYSSIKNINNGSCLLELSLENMASLTKDHLIQLSTTSDALANLKSLQLRQIDAMDDEVLENLLKSIKFGNLEGIDLSHNVHLTDLALSFIRQSNRNGTLKSLVLSGIKNFTAAGLETFFTFDIPGLPYPPTLRTLDISNCAYDSMNETVANLAIAASALKRGGSGNGNSTDNGGKNSGDVSTMGGLVYLDVSGSSITDTNCENLAKYCHMSLRELKINFCTKVSDQGIGYLVSKVKHQFSKIEIWGCAQITDSFLDGHSRVDDGGLEITGAWMAKK